MPLVKYKDHYLKFDLKKKHINNIWPTIIPSSSISFTRKFFFKCIKLGIFNNYELLEIDFRINAYSRNIEKNYVILDNNLTVYRNVFGGIMSNIKKFTYIWWTKRLQAHFFMRFIYKIKNKNYFYINADFIFTLIIIYIFNIFCGKPSLRN